MVDGLIEDACVCYIIRPAHGPAPRLLGAFRRERCAKDCREPPRRNLLRGCARVIGHCAKAVPLYHLCPVHIY